MKAKDLHERTVEDLKELEKTLSKDLFDARFKNFTNRLDDTALLNRNRREIARIKTVLALKSRVGAKGTSPATQKSPVAADEKPIPKAAASKPAKKAAAPKADKPSKPAAKKTTKKTEKKA
jgi:large subunit ribosomal protein L29